MAAANFAPPRHHHHFRRCPPHFTPPNPSSLLIAKTWFLSRKLSPSSPFWASIERARISHGQLANCSPSPSSTSPEVSAATAESCVNLGLSLFAKGRVKDALAQFDTALTLDPNPVEAQAALYNKACCHAYREEAKKAADCLRTALRDYDLKFGTILNDPDLASFRAMPEFKELQEEARLGGEDVGYGFRRDLKLISEVQAPFRGIRKFFYVAFTAAAGISLSFTIPRLFLAIKGGEGAPGLLETSQNAGINIGGIIVFVALFFWDNKKEEEQLAQITRNETLSRLPLRLSTNRIVELVQLRDTSRPVILAGNKDTVDSAMRKAERFRTELLKRGVILVPVVWGERRERQVEKKGFGLSPKAAASLPSIGEEFDKRTQSIVANSKIKAEIRFRAEVVSPAEWESNSRVLYLGYNFSFSFTLSTLTLKTKSRLTLEKITLSSRRSSPSSTTGPPPLSCRRRAACCVAPPAAAPNPSRWIRDQQKSEGITPGEDVYVILRLDGRVRKSGRGMPDWQEIVKEVPPMEAFLSKLER